MRKTSITNATAGAARHNMYSSGNINTISSRITLSMYLSLGAIALLLCSCHKRISFSVMHYSSLLHDDLNTPALVDDDLRDHMQRLHDNGFLNNTLFIWMADHGHRFASTRSTHQVRVFVTSLVVLNCCLGPTRRTFTTNGLCSAKTP